MILSCFISLALALHPIHLSVTEVEYSDKDKTLQITTRIFIDDLELSVRKAVRQPELDLLKPTGSTTDQLVSDYLKRHLSLRVDGKPVILNYLGHETEDVAIICYIETPVIRKASTVEIANTVIQETHADQSNIVHLTFNGSVQSARLTVEQPSFVFTIPKKK